MENRIEVIGAATLYLGDCREIMADIERPAAIVCDPPYGQGLNTNVTGKSVTGRSAGSGRPYAIHDKRRKTASGIHSIGMATEFPQGIEGDSKETPFDVTCLLPMADRVLMWGAHKFAEKLPRGRWLAWDKVPTGKVRDQGDGEMAWTNVNPDAVTRFYRLLWDGVCVGSAARHEVTAGQRRVHPTQKPQALMAWCLGFVEAPAGSVIADPCMGAGSTGLAVLDAGYSFVGVEKVPFYFDVACRRIEDAQRQGRLIA
jgi:site-specific DNA-methyltransferase (adenine-specific)